MPRNFSRMLPPSCDKDGARAPGFCSFLGTRSILPHLPRLKFALTAPPPATSTLLVRMPRVPARGEETRKEGGRSSLKKKTNKKPPSTREATVEGSTPPRRRCCLPERTTRRVVGRIAPLLMETHRVRWAGDSISQHAPRRARPAATWGLAPALARRRCIGARGGCSHGGACGDGGGNE